MSLVVSNPAPPGGGYWVISRPRSSSLCPRSSIPLGHILLQLLIRVNILKPRHPLPAVDHRQAMILGDQRIDDGAVDLRRDLVGGLRNHGNHRCDPIDHPTLRRSADDSVARQVANLRTGRVEPQHVGRMNFGERSEALQ